MPGAHRTSVCCMPVEFGRCPRVREPTRSWVVAMSMLSKREHEVMEVRTPMTTCTKDEVGHGACADESWGVWVERAM